MNNFCAECGSIFTIERAAARKILAEASWEKPRRDTRSVAAGTPYREVLEQVERSADADRGPQMMRRGYLAMKNCSWEDFEERYRKEGKLCEWTFERIREAYEKVAQEDVGRLSIAEEILTISTDFLMRIIASRRNGRSHFVVRLPALQLFPFG